MNNAVYQSRVNGLTSIAKKIFSVVPVVDAWTPNQIKAELGRLTNSSADIRVIEGCLTSLINQGLVTEPKPKTYRRVAMKEPKTANDGVIEKQKIVETKTVAIQKQQKQVAAIEKLAGIASRALDISSSLKQLAADIDAAAIEIDEQAKTDKQDTEKLKQLQTLLRSLGA